MKDLSHDFANEPLDDLSNDRSDDHARDPADDLAHDSSSSHSSVDCLFPRVISGITPNPRKLGRFSILVDGDELATMSIEAIERLHLSVGVVVDARLAGDIENEAGILATYDRALNMLAFRARSSAELRRLLIRKAEQADRVDLAIARLVTAGFLDDKSFARQFARSKAVVAGQSRRRVQQELSKRGVGRELAKEAIDEVFVEEGVDEAESIERVARKKMRSLTKVDAPTRRRRLYSFLARRGYDAGDISRVMRIVLDSADADAVAETLADTMGDAGVE